MSYFNKKTPGTKTINLAGGKAYSHNPEMELVTAVLTTFLENKYYESGESRVDRIKNLCRVCDHEFIGKLAVMARTDFNLRSVSHLLVGALARLHRGDDLVCRVIEKVAIRPDDLTEIVAYLGKPIPKQVKRGIRHTLLKFNPYQLAKYRGEGKKTKLVDLFNLTHPNPNKSDHADAWKALIDGTLKNTETWETMLSSGTNKGQVWAKLINEDKLGYMALLRNLRNIDEQASQDVKAAACAIIANPERVKKSKQLPFRFYSAYEQVKNRQMLDAISSALDYSVSNVPELSGKMLIGVDVSGSMKGDPIKKASIFAAALMKKNNADVILYDDAIRDFKFISSSPVLALAEKIQNEATGGGTETSLVFKYATFKNYDRIVILSDNESWIDLYWGSSETQLAYNEYRQTGANPFVYAIDIEGNGTKDITSNRVYHLVGWSERIFDFMQWIEKENQMVDFVKKVEL